MAEHDEQEKVPSQKRKAKRAVVGENANSIPFILGDAYPNPFYAIATLPVTLLQSGYVRLELYNRSNMLVSTLIDRQMEPGEYKVFIKKELAGLIAGKYYCQLRFINESSSSETRKAVQVM